jgi:hypothetical protein
MTLARQLCLSSDMQLDTWVFLGVVGGGGNGGGSGDSERWCWRAVVKLWLPPVPHMFRIIDKRLITPVVGWGDHQMCQRFRMTGCQSRPSQASGQTDARGPR